MASGPPLYRPVSEFVYSILRSRQGTVLTVPITRFRRAALAAEVDFPQGLKRLCENLDFHKVPLFDDEVNSFCRHQKSNFKKLWKLHFPKFSHTLYSPPVPGAYSRAPSGAASCCTPPATVRSRSAPPSASRRSFRSGIHPAAWVWIPASLQAWGAGFPFAICTSICRRIVTR